MGSQQNPIQRSMLPSICHQNPDRVLTKSPKRSIESNIQHQIQAWSSYQIHEGTEEEFGDSLSRKHQAAAHRNRNVESPAHSSANDLYKKLKHAPHTEQPTSATPEGDTNQQKKHMAQASSLLEWDALRHKRMRREEKSEKDDSLLVMPSNQAAK